MMETINAGTNYIRLVQTSYHMNLNSALYGLVTPPRRQTKPPSKRLSMPANHQFQAQSPTMTEMHGIPKSPASRNSPSRLSPSVLEGKGFYAGAKFGERPLPTELPKPPNHWVGSMSEPPSCIEMTNSLKVLLKVQS